MQCLNKSFFKKEIKRYASVLGSEEAAYYVLAMNNGYTLDKNPDGTDSELYAALVLANGGDEDAALLSKSVVYTPAYTDKYGNWHENFDITNGSEEPSIVTLNNDLLLCNNDAIKSILSDPKDTIDRLISMELANQLDRDPVISQAIREEREAYVEQAMQNITTNMDEDELDMYRNNLRIEWNKRKLFRVKRNLINDLSAIFGGAVRYDVSTDLYVGTDAFSNIQALILNTLSKLDNSKDFISDIDNQNEFTIITLLRQLILNVDPEVQLRTVIESYLRMFGNSLPMQEAFSQLKDKFPNRSADSMIREIADYISGDVSRTSRRREINRSIETFWQKFKNFLRTIIPGLHKKDYNTRRNILDALTSYFAILEDLEDADNTQLLIDMRMWSILDTNLKTTAADVIKRIKSGIESRIKSINSVTNTDANQQELLTLQNWLADIEALESVALDKLEDEEYQLIDRFLVNGLQEIHDASMTLSSIKDLNTSDINAEKLLRIKTDVIGFYENILSKYIAPMMRAQSHEFIQPGGAVYSSIRVIENALGPIKRDFDAQLERYTDHIVDKFVDENVDVGNKERIRINMKLWLRNKINNGELAFLDKYFSSGVSSLSPIVRMLDTYLREARLAAHKGALRGKELYNLYKKAAGVLDNLSFKNFARQFCEVDEDGKLTGNFVAPVNKGAFDKKLQDGIAKLDKQFGLTFDEDGNRIFESEEQLKEYEDAKDDLIEQIGGHRRYTSQYYKDRRKFLSRGTMEVQQKLRRDIDRILAKCTEEVKIDGKKVKIQVEANLASEDRLKLNELRKQQENLGNLYDIVFDPVTGKITSIKEKTGVALQMAKEIAAWNSHKASKLKYTANNAKYKAVRQALVDKYGADSYQVKLFEYQNSTQKLSEKYYDTLNLIFSNRPSKTKEVAELLARRKSILDACRTKRGYYEPNLDLLSDEAFAELKKIDEELAEESSNGNLEKWQIEMLENLQTRKWVRKQGLNITYYDWLRLQYEVRSQVNPSAMLEFYDKFTYTSGSKVRALSCFSYKGPLDEENYVQESATGQFMEVDESSIYYDNGYDEENEDFIQPDKYLYENKQYNKIQDNPDMKAFYDKLIEIMDEIWSLLPNISRLYRYQMPQRRGESSRLWLRKGFLTNAKTMLQQAWTITERDTEYNEDFTRRPDGSIVETIPIRWIRRLQDPNTIDTNIVGSVSEMLEMALSFNEKRQFVPIMELINFLLYGGFAGDTVNSKDQAERFAQHMSMYMYGRMRAGFRKFKKLSTVERGLQKLFLKVNSVVWNKYMPHNWNSVAKNAIDSFWSLLSEVSSGKYFSQDDLLAAIKYCFGKDLKHFGPISSIANVNVPTMTAKLMQYNRVSGSIRDIFDGAELSRLRRTLESTKTGEYTAVDYMFKGVVTEMVYHSYRLITNPSTGKKEFMNREQAQYAYVKIGATNDAGQKAYDEANITLRDAYEEDENGMVRIKKEYVDIVTPELEGGRRSRKLETRISNTILERCSIINGMLDEMDRNVVSLNYVGATILLMRGWLLSQQIDYNKRGHDFAIYADGSEAIQNLKDAGILKRTKNAFIDSGSTQIVQEDENYQGLYNFATGTVDKGAWVGLTNAYWKWVKAGMLAQHFHKNDLTQQLKLQIARMNTCILAVMVLSAMTFVFGSLREGDPDDWVYAYLYNISVSSISERATQLGHAFLVFVLSDLILSPAVASGYIKDISEIPQPLFDMISILHDLATGGTGDIEAYDIVKSGSYKGLERYKRNLLKASSEIPGLNTYGIDNMYKNFSMSAMDSRGDWFAQIAPTPWISYVPRFNNPEKGLSGIWGLLLNKDDQESPSFLNQVKNTLKQSVTGFDEAGENSQTNREKSSSKKKNSSNSRIGNRRNRR